MPKIPTDSREKPDVVTPLIGNRIVNSDPAKDLGRPLVFVVPTHRTIHRCSGTVKLMFPTIPLEWGLSYPRGRYNGFKPITCLS